MRVISYCDGIGIGKEALRSLGHPNDFYIASEIHGPSRRVAKRNHPDIVHAGDMETFSFGDAFYPGEIDLVMAGTPCQGFSMAGNRLNFEDPRSRLFFKFADEVNKLRPKYFLFENVPMSKESEKIITKYLGVNPIVIDSQDFTLQKRRRLYWTNIPVRPPRDVYKPGLNDASGFGSRLNKNEYFINYSSSGRGRNGIEGRFYLADKSQTLTKKGYSRRSLTAVYETSAELEPGKYYPAEIEGMEFKDSCPYILKSGNKKLKFKRSLTAEEWEELQGITINYTMGESERQRKAMLGDAWSLPVIKHILSYMEF